MSLAETPAGVSAEGTPGTAEGSPQVPTPGTPETQVEGTPPGASPDGSTTSESSEAAELARLRQELSAREQELAQARNTIAFVESNPDAMAVLAGTGPQKSDDDIKTFVSERFGSLDEKGAWAKTMEEFAKLVLNRGKEAALAELETRLKSLDHAVAGNRFERAATGKGVEFDTLNGPEWKAHIQDMKTANPAFARLMNARPDEAADWAVARWQLRAESRTGAAAERARLARIQGAKLNGSSPRGSASMPEKLLVRKNDPERVSKTADFVKKHGIAALTDGRIQIVP